MLRRASLPERIVRGLVQSRRGDEDLGAEVRLRLRAIADLVAMAVSPPSRTPINGTLGPHRRFDWLALAANVPEPFAVADEAVVTVAYAANRQVDWLAGRGRTLAAGRWPTAAPTADGALEVVLEGPLAAALAGGDPITLCFSGEDKYHLTSWWFTDK